MIRDPRLALARRAAAAQATADRFRDRPFKLGVNDCLRMTAYHLRKLGRRVPLPIIGAYRSRPRAVLLLRERGYDSLAAAIDGLALERIAPAAALVGDIIMLDSADELGALAIAMGNGRVLGYHERAEGAVVMQPKMTGIAWRVVA